MQFFNIYLFRTKPVAKSAFQQIWSKRKKMESPQAEPGSKRGHRGQRALWVIMYVGTWAINLRLYVCLCEKGEFVLMGISKTLAFCCVVLYGFMYLFVVQLADYHGEKYTL